MPVPRYVNRAPFTDRAHFFAGLPNREVAEVLGRSLRTVELSWTMAKGWLAQKLGD